MDADSAVREGEIDLAQSAQSALNRLRTLFANYTEGDKLSEQQRREIQQTMQVLATGAEESIAEIGNRSRHVLKTLGGNTDLIPEYTPEVKNGPGAAKDGDTKTIGGSTFVRKNGKWEEQ